MGVRCWPSGPRWVASRSAAAPAVRDASAHARAGPVGRRRGVEGAGVAEAVQVVDQVQHGHLGQVGAGGVAQPGDPFGRAEELAAGPGQRVRQVPVGAHRGQGLRPGVERRDGQRADPGGELLGGVADQLPEHGPDLPAARGGHGSWPVVPTCAVPSRVTTRDTASSSAVSNGWSGSRSSPVGHVQGDPQQPGQPGPALGPGPRRGSGSGPGPHRGRPARGGPTRAPRPPRPDPAPPSTAAARRPAGRPATTAARRSARRTAPPTTRPTRHPGGPPPVPP